MPLLKIQASVATPDPSQVNRLLKQLSSQLANHLHKSEAYVMTAFEADIPMTFGGSEAPACYLEVKSVGTISPLQTQAISQDLCQILEDELKIPKNRIYIEFNESKGSLWGWNGTTFG
ncbi:phenylpyruvate tautomerase MIF-related protein [Lyngbya confervoides]|uniref:L-dopachrome isomerase n=1 Tax=Lyngbya confervoides BDU141951 TaxID=1574623 RepID=A0ABD4T3Z2_9CYAN|nr:phenylpyruvate tautomerase MIF-related protein [Lyngbya confervoides]MCM1983394.1 phenylpyruvate tautomerase MIF-related protein [Lyngbya confervoides BDU141951]